MAQIECDYCTKSFKSETGYLWHLDHLHSELVATHAQNPSRLADDEGHSPQNVEDYDSKWARESGPVEEEDSAGEEAILHELRELLPNLLEMMAKRREELERSKSVKIDVDGLNRKLTTIEASVATIERKLNRLEKVIKALSRLVTHVDMQLKPKEFVDVFVEELEPEALKGARREVRLML